MGPQQPVDAKMVHRHVDGTVWNKLLESLMVLANESIENAAAWTKLQPFQSAVRVHKYELSSHTSIQARISLFRPPAMRSVHLHLGSQDVQRPAASISMVDALRLSSSSLDSPEAPERKI